MAEKPYVHQDYPTTLYAWSGNEPGYVAKVVKSSDARQALGGGWYDSPADVKAPSTEPAPPPAPAPSTRSRTKKAPAA